MNKTQKGFALLETLLILVVIVIISGTGWYVWHSKNQSDQSLNNAANTSVKTAVNSSIKSYDDCVKSPGSIEQETYPSVCVTKNGQRFTQPLPTKFVTVQEWGIKFEDKTGLNLSYKISDSHHLTLTNPDLIADSSCDSPGSTGYILRYLPNDTITDSKFAEPSGGFMTAQQEADIEKDNNNTSSYKFINGYYYFSSYLKGDACGNTQQVQDVSLKIATSVASIIPGLSSL